MTADKARIAKQFIEMIPHSKALGMSILDIGDGMAEITMPYDKRLVGDPETGVIHGGAVSTLMDTTCGASVMSHPKSPAGTATIDLRIDYMRAATPGQAILARATCHHITRSNVVSGIYFSNPLLNTVEDLDDLDAYLQTKIASLPPGRLKNRLASQSFKYGYQTKRYSKFSARNLFDIVEVWKHAS